MKLATSLRWALYYRGLALLSFLVGAAIALAGVWVGLYEVVAYLLSISSAMEFASASTLSGAVGAARPIPGAALVLLGLFVWQVGKTAAFYKTLTEATESEMADRFDTQTVKSEILAALDDQLSDLHADVETTRRQVSRLSREEHAEALEVSAHDAAASGRSGVDDGAASSDGTASSSDRSASGTSVSETSQSNASGRSASSNDAADGSRGGQSGGRPSNTSQ
ncbi:hypothetical protein SAMN06269185_2135 [Natronoarchaeum philippinense]|uniref:Uncharacterized protein n=1 Tax=Natronoarchaeum philippinense TaxID=558529 RepID=A0A285NWD7_NATPI|nr:hypothetical protein [Natronoarchaeum philippinense]SNZ13357.1 hypothetical protein SAMN06269185_2135 [Natronoarchaeum philippinense]